MKLKTKLIPLASVVAVSATAIPLSLTSCGTEGLVSMLERYVPNIPQHEWAYLTLDEVATDYITAVQNNPEIFVQDFYWYASNSVIQIGKENAKFHRIKVSDVKCDKFEVTGQPYTIMPLISYNLEYEMQYTFQLDNKTSRDYTYKGKSSYVNIPFRFDFDSELGLWHIDWNDTFLPTVEFAKDVDWSAKITYSEVNVYTINESIYGPHSYTESTGNEYEINAQGVILQQFDAVDAARMQAALNEDAMLCSWYLYSVNWIGA